MKKHWGKMLAAAALLALLAGCADMQGKSVSSCAYPAPSSCSG